MHNNKFDNLLTLLKDAQNKHQLDIALNCLLEMIEKEVLNSKIPTEIQEIFRDKIYNLVILRGDIVDKLYLALYIIYKDCKFDDRFLKIEGIAKEAMLQNGISDNEKLMLLELAVLAKILKGEADNAIDFYIQNIVLIDIHALESQKSAEFILQAFKYFKIPFETLKKNLLHILDSFDSLDYKQKRSFFNWQLHIFWNVTHYFNHKGWLDFYDIWKGIFYQEVQKIEVSSMDFALYLHFFIYHMCGNNFSSQKDWEKFNTEITLYASSYYKDFAQKFELPKAQRQDTKIIGILRDRIVENSPYKVEYSFLKTLLQDEDFKKNYKIKIYLMSFIEKSDNDLDIVKNYVDLGVEVLDVGQEYNKLGYYNSHLGKALALRDMLLKDQVEFLISPNNGYGISDFILSTRSCLKQIFWSHGNFVYDGDFLDTKITHICGNQEKILHQGYNFRGIPVKMDRYFYNPDISENAVKKIRDLYPKDAYILGNIGRLVKIDNEVYLQTIIDILRDNPKTIFLACGSGNIEEIKMKIQNIDSSLMHRFYFTGFVDSAVYGHVLDLWLDSFPMQQGESRIEFSAKDKLSLVLSEESLDQRRNRLEQWFQIHQKLLIDIALKYKITEEEIHQFLCQDNLLVAFCIKDYIAKAKELINLPKESLEQLIIKQRIIREVNDTLRQRLGKKLFLEMLSSL
ncbi:MULTISPECIES: hypothetical protein [unclassified Helicobacter]|uniref:hypothetical protein n=1 Tax=unclassified Helicobacter TaxID=2593540 RepID=UPI000CF13ECD|nr:MULTISPECIES: hypothetical protein [unclassified Helicobacter]